MSSWKECKLGDVISSISETYKFTNEKVVFLNTSDVYLGKILNKNEFNPKDLPGQAKKRIKKNDLLFSEIRPANGRYAFVVDDAENYVVSTKLMVLRSSENILPSFLNIFLTSKDMLEYLQMLAEDRSGTFPQITFDNISNIDISLPSLEEQKAIAEVLSSLDDKIDLLHRQNQTLESLAQTLFRQWFIEEAKEEWEEKPLSEIALHIKNNVKPSSFENKLFFHFSLPAFDNEQRPIKELGREILSNKYQVLKNSILVSKLNPRTPRIWLVDENIEENDSICSTEFQVLYPKEEIWRDFIYCFLKTEQSVQELAGASSGTSGSHQRVKPEDIFNLTFLYPDMDTLKKFEEQSSNCWRKIKVNQKQIQTLENLRDTLLPNLLSGEVRVEI